MQENENIFNLLKEEEANASRRAMRGVILQPGAIGDCILTLPLAEFMKDRLGLGGVDILGHTEYTGILPGRTCVDSIRSIDSVDLHRLFVEPNTFDLADGDALINVFSDYSWIVTFLGEPDSNFERNLIFTANCSRSVEVITLPMKPPEKLSSHITDFYIEQFAAQSGLPSGPTPVCKTKNLIKAAKADINRGKELLEEINAGHSEKLIVIQPGSGGLHKCWHLDNFLSTAKAMASEGADVIFLLGPAEMERLSTSTISRIESISKILTNLSLADVLAVLSNANGYIGNDSGITHLAAALGIQTAAVFGPTDPAVYGPIGPAVTILQSGEPDVNKRPENLQEKILKALSAN
ncbi:MAG: glycosyltransferase family 9 protein [Phycisphaerae bacterium]|jgi:hypothetical protein